MDITININDLKCSRCGEENELTYQITNDLKTGLRTLDIICISCEKYERVNLYKLNLKSKIEWHDND